MSPATIQQALALNEGPVYSFAPGFSAIAQGAAGLPTMAGEQYISLRCLWLQLSTEESYILHQQCDQVWQNLRIWQNSDLWGLGGEVTSPLYPLIKTITAIIFYLARLIKYIKHLFLFIVCIATQVVILPPHIPWKGQWGGILLLRYSMLCFNGLSFGKAVIVILNVLYLGSKDYFIF